MSDTSPAHLTVYVIRSRCSCFINIFTVFSDATLVIIIIMSKDNIIMMSKDHNDNKCLHFLVSSYILMYICMYEVGGGRSVSNIDGRWDIAPPPPNK